MEFGNEIRNKVRSLLFHVPNLKRSTCVNASRRARSIRDENSCGWDRTKGIKAEVRGKLRAFLKEREGKEKAGSLLRRLLEFYQGCKIHHKMIPDLFWLLMVGMSVLGMAVNADGSRISISEDEIMAMASLLGEDDSPPLSAEGGVTILGTGAVDPATTLDCHRRLYSYRVSSRNSIITKMPMLIIFVFFFLNR